MHNGVEARMARLFNRQGDGRAVCVAADHGYMSDVTPNVVKLKPITEAVIRGGVDGILMSPGQAARLAPLFQGRSGPALIVDALPDFDGKKPVPPDLMKHQCDRALEWIKQKRIHEIIVLEGVDIRL